MWVFLAFPINLTAGDFVGHSSHDGPRFLVWIDRTVKRKALSPEATASSDRGQAIPNRPTRGSSIRRPPARSCPRVVSWAAACLGNPTPKRGSYVSAESSGGSGGNSGNVFSIRRPVDEE